MCARHTSHDTHSYLSTPTLRHDIEHVQHNYKSMCKKHIEALQELHCVLLRTELARSTDLLSSLEKLRRSRVQSGAMGAVKRPSPLRSENARSSNRQRRCCPRGPRGCAQFLLFYDGYPSLRKWWWTFRHRGLFTPSGRDQWPRHSRSCNRSLRCQPAGAMGHRRVAR